MKLSPWLSGIALLAVVGSAGVARADRASAVASARVLEERIDAGRDALYEGHFIKAERIFEAVLDLDPASRAALEGGAEAAFENAHYFKALMWAERACARAATRANYILIGHANLKLGQFASAAAAYAKALEIRPGDVDLQQRLRAARDEAEAEKHARTVLTSNLATVR